MTKDQTDGGSGLLRVALRAYPRAARTAHAQELAAIYAEATAGAGRVATLREAMDVAGHGLRLRCGLGGQGRADEIVARAAPLAVVLCAAQGLAYLAYVVVTALTPPQLAQLGGAYLTVLLDASGATLVWLAVLALLLSGRPGAARILGAIGTLGQFPVVLTALPGLGTGRLDAVCSALLPSLFVSLLLLAAPRDMLGAASPRDRLAVGWTGVLALVPYVIMLVVHRTQVTVPIVTLVWFVPAVLALALVLARRDAAGPIALGVAAVVGLLRFDVPELVRLDPAWTSSVAVLTAVVVVFAWRRWIDGGADGRTVRS
ncbi:hypothetical protein [Streptacidiphilus anmyonensis]|uniref:hypothetical protein n=1 Tax=Streptacidiphilus anmyonensis TaxID=405782 RepID=UPI000A758CCE|nr:hypothetical protein [Streptacidiphilus anmyonensis]